MLGRQMIATETPEVMKLIDSAAASRRSRAITALPPLTSGTSTSTCRRGPLRRLSAARHGDGDLVMTGISARRMSPRLARLPSRLRCRRAASWRNCWRASGASAGPHSGGKGDLARSYYNEERTGDFRWRAYEVLVHASSQPVPIERPRRRIRMAKPAVSYEDAGATMVAHYFNCGKEGRPSGATFFCCK